MNARLRSFRGLCKRLLASNRRRFPISGASLFVRFLMTSASGRKMPQSPPAPERIEPSRPRRGIVITHTLPVFVRTGA